MLAIDSIKNHSAIEMTRQSPAKRSYKLRPGLIQAARDLGVSYGHLRMCVAGVRTSVSLMARLAEWQRANSTTEAKP